MPSPSCISCGYSLDGLTREALCPECAFPVARSLDATPLLRTAEPRWLARIASGFRAMERGNTCWYLALVAWFPMVVFVIILLFSGRIGGHGPGPPAWYSIVLAISAALSASAFVTGLVLTAYGLWNATTPAPSLHSPPRWARLLMRWCGLSLVILTVALTTISAASRLSHLGTPALCILRAFIQIAGLLFFLALSRLLHHFERSLPNRRPDLSQRARNTRKNIAALAIAFVIGWYQVITRGKLNSELPLGLAPILFGIFLLCFERTMTRIDKGITAEHAAAQAGPVVAQAMSPSSDEIAG